MTRAIRVVILAAAIFIALLPLAGVASAQDPYPPQAPRGGEIVEQPERGLGGGGGDEGPSTREIIFYVAVTVAAAGTIAAGVWGVKSFLGRG